MNDIFVHLLYESVQLPEVGRHTAVVGCVYTNCTKLGGPVAPCTPGVQLMEPKWQVTMLWGTICSEWHFRIPAVRMCTTSSTRSRIAVVGCVYTNCTKLGGDVVPFTTCVRLPDRSRMFTGPFGAICSEQHFCTPALQICMSSTNRSLTVPVDCVFTNCTKLGGPVALCTPGVRLRERTRKFTRPWRIICSERHFCTPAVQLGEPYRSVNQV